jgi:NTP pyrophosphatase (non-canonical NTP hydrolase)
MADYNPKNFEGADDQFTDCVSEELQKARKKFPSPNPNLAALTEEVGELAQALLHVREGKEKSWWAIYDEAVQVAVMAQRVAIEGDETLGVVPTEENTK